MRDRVSNQRGSLVLYLAALAIMVMIAGSAFFLWQRSKISPTSSQMMDSPMLDEQINPPSNSPSSSDSADINVEDNFKVIDLDLEAL